MNPRNNEPQTEDRIETVLAALHDAKPVPGLEQRISAALLRQSDESSIPSLRWIWLRMPHLAGLAAVVAAALLLSIRMYRQTAAPSAKNHAALRLPTEHLAEKAVGLSPLNPAVLGEGGQPRHALTGVKAPLQSEPHVSGLKATAFSRKAAQANTIERQGETALPVEQAALELGFPAPPLPLTEQERLLVRLVHRDDPMQLAQLAPAAREAELQRDREQVREFFKAPPMLAANFKLEPYPTGGTQ